MGDLTFWLHMNESYMWRWFCSASDGTIIAISAQSFFNLADAERALSWARSVIGKTELAA
jgi:hypothetical protein